MTRAWRRDECEKCYGTGRVLKRPFPSLVVRTHEVECPRCGGSGRDLLKRLREVSR